MEDKSIISDKHVIVADLSYEQTLWNYEYKPESVSDSRAQVPHFGSWGEKYKKYFF